MRGTRFLTALPALFLFLSVCACSLVSQQQSHPAWHPEAVPEGRVDCIDCHQDQIRGVSKPNETFKHSTRFIKQHRLFASRDQELCELCHRTSFCNDCHANELEVKPSIKLGNRPDRELIHRGDYLTLHMIDGKVDPTSCFRCHGRSNNEKCVTCHR